MAGFVRLIVLFLPIAIAWESYSYTIREQPCACDQCYAELRRPNEVKFQNKKLLKIQK